MATSGTTVTTGSTRSGTAATTEGTIAETTYALMQAFFFLRCIDAGRNAITIAVFGNAKQTIHIIERVLTIFSIKFSCCFTAGTLLHVTAQIKQGIKHTADNIFIAGREKSVPNKLPEYGIASASGKCTRNAASLCKIGLIGGTYHAIGTVRYSA